MRKFTRNNLSIFRFILIVFLIWRILLIFVTFLGFKNSDCIYNYLLAWSNWDGGHFRGIAENGYLPQQTVFFPLYPLLIKILIFLGFSSIWSGLLVSNFSFFIGLFFLYKLVILDFDKSVAKNTVMGILIFPLSFYFGAVYSESLFLATALISFYYARKEKWAVSALFTALSISTRLVGIATLLGILIIYLKTSKKIFTKNLFLIFCSLFPLWLYIIFQKIYLFNSLGFLSNEISWRRQLSFPWQPIITAIYNLNISNLFTISFEQPAFFELAFFILGCVGLFFCYKKLSRSYLTFFLIAFLMPLFSGTLTAFPRYLSVIFPIYILFGLIKNSLVKLLIIFLCIILTTIFSLMYINNQWLT